MTRLKELARVYPLGSVAILLATLGAFVAVGATIVGQGQKIPFLDNDRYELEAVFSDAGGLKPEKQPLVTVAGVAMGSVSKVRYENGTAVATLELDTDARGRIYKDATALITPRSALNDLTVDVDPGRLGKGTLDDGATIRQNRTIAPENLDRVTEVLDVDTRAHLQVVADQLELGVRGRSGELRSSLASLGPALDSSGRVAAALSERPRLLSQFVTNLDVVFDTLGDRGTHLRQVIGSGERTLSTVRRRQDALAGSVRELAPALSALDAAMTQLNTLSGPLRPTLRRLRPFARELPEALTSLRRFSPEGLGLARDLDALSAEGRRPVNSARRLLQELRPAARALQRPTERLEPIVRALDDHNLGIGELGSNFGGIFSVQDLAGPTLRGYGFFEPPRPENFGMPANTKGAPLVAMRRRLALALENVCRKDTNVVACLGRTLIPGLPNQLVTRTRGSG